VIIGRVFDGLHVVFLNSSFIKIGSNISLLIMDGADDKQGSNHSGQPNDISDDPLLVDISGF
jgi:hypothetical protein